MKIQASFTGLGLVSFANLFSAMFGGIFWLILAPLLAVSDYGQINYDIAIPSTLGGIALLGLTYTVTTYTAKGNKKIKLQANFLVLLTSVGVAIPLFFIDWSLAFFLLANNFFQMALSFILGEKSYKKYAILLIGSRSSQIVLSLLLFSIMGPIGVILGYAFSLIIFGYNFFLKISFSPNFNEIKKYWKYTSFNFGIHVASVFYFFMDKVIIASLYGFNILGFYTFGFHLIMALSFLPSSLSVYLLPEEASGSKTRKIKIVSIIISIFLTVVAYFLIPIAVNLFFPQFLDSIIVAQIMILSLFPATVSSIINSQFLAAGNSKSPLIGMLIFVGINFTGIFVLGQLYGLVGLAVSLVVGHIGQSSYLLLTSKISKKTVVKDK